MEHLELNRLFELYRHLDRFHEDVILLKKLILRYENNSDFPSD